MTKKYVFPELLGGMIKAYLVNGSVKITTFTYAQNIESWSW